MRGQHIGKGLVAPVQPEGGTECGGGRGRKQRRSGTGDKFIGPAAERIEFPACEPTSNRRAPDMLAAILLPTGVGVRHAIGVANVILIEADRIHALGQEAAAVGIDKPEHAVALVNTEKPASAEAVIGDSTPFGSLQAETPTAEKQ
jgi:hypothetical protein